MKIDELELRISKLLRIGVFASGFFILLGWTITTFQGGASLFIFKDYDQLDFLTQIFIAYNNGQWGILTSFFGLASLILLPVLRVLLTSLLFFSKKEIKIGFIALFVLVLLFISFILGFRS